MIKMGIKNVIKKDEETEWMRFIREGIGEVIRNDIRRIEWIPYEEDIYDEDLSLTNKTLVGYKAEYRGLKLRIYPGVSVISELSEDKERIISRRVEIVYNFRISDRWSSAEDDLPISNIEYDSFVEDFLHSGIEDTRLGDYKSLYEAKEALFRKLEDTLVEYYIHRHYEYTKLMEDSGRS